MSAGKSMAYLSVLGVQRYLCVVEINVIVVDQRNQQILSAVSLFANISSIMPSLLGQEISDVAVYVLGKSAPSFCVGKFALFHHVRCSSIIVC